jgi:hypothetical protein
MDSIIENRSKIYEFDSIEVDDELDTVNYFQIRNLSFAYVTNHLSF